MRENQYQCRINRTQSIPLKKNIAGNIPTNEVSSYEVDQITLQEKVHKCKNIHFNIQHIKKKILVYVQLINL